MSERNVLGGELEVCGTEPMTGFFRDGCCNIQGQAQVMHTICAIVTDEFLAHQSAIGNDLQTPRPEFGFPGLHPGDPWCVTAHNWVRAHDDGVAAPIRLAATNESVLRLVPLDVLQEYAVDVPSDLRGLEDPPA